MPERGFANRRASVVAGAGAADAGARSRGARVCHAGARRAGARCRDTGAKGVRRGQSKPHRAATPELVPPAVAPRASQPG